MPAILTMMRRKKTNYLRMAQDGILNLLLDLRSSDMDKVNMRHFKELSQKVVDIETIAKKGNLNIPNNSKN